MAFSKMRTWLRSHFSCKKKKAQNFSKSFLLCCATFTVSDDEDEEMEYERNPSYALCEKDTHKDIRSDMCKEETYKDIRSDMCKEETYKDIRSDMCKEETYKDIRSDMCKEETYKDIRSDMCKEEIYKDIRSDMCKEETYKDIRSDMCKEETYKDIRSDMCKEEIYKDIRSDMCKEETYKDIRSDMCKEDTHKDIRSDMCKEEIYKDIRSDMCKEETYKDIRSDMCKEEIYKDIRSDMCKEETYKGIRPDPSIEGTHKELLRSCSETKKELLKDKKSPVPAVSAKNLQKGCKSKCYLRNKVIYVNKEGFCPCPIHEIDQMKLQKLSKYQKRSRNFCIRYVDTEYIHGRMSVVSILGAGGFGFVYLVRDMEREINLAAKIIPQKASSDAMIRTEIQILKTIKSNPLCIEFDSYVKYEVPPDVQKHFLFLKYFPSCTLRQFPRAYCITTENIHFILGQIGMGLKYLHGINIIHRDIKGDNILINDMCQIKLIDFGLSAIGTSFKGYCGTRYYEAPEVLIHSVEKDAKPYSFAADYYSLGVSAYQLIYGTSPCDYKLKMFGLDEKDSVCKKDAQREIAAGCIDYPPDSDESRQDVIRKLLVPDPEQRLGDETYLLHSFFKGKVLKQLLKCGLKAQRKNPLGDDVKTKIPVVEGRDKLDDAVPSLANERLI